MKHSSFFRVVFLNVFGNVRILLRMISSVKNLFFLPLILFVIIIGYYSYTTFVYKTAHVHTLSFVKEEYLRCVSKDKNDDAKESCLEALSVVTYDSFSIKDITTEIDSLPNEEKNRGCHKMMHYLGWRAFVVKQDVATAFLQSSEFCNSGMYHGIMEEYLREHGLQGDITHIVTHVCTDSLANYPDLSEGIKSLCYHGLGHGLMYITTSDLRASLDYCDLLSSAQQQQSCYGGVFMEYTMSKPNIASVDIEDNYPHCEPLTVHQKTFCYFNQGLSYLIREHGNVTKAMRSCLVLVGDDQHECLLGVGASFPSPGGSSADFAATCLSVLKVSKDAYRACIEGGLRSIAQLDQGGARGATQFCETAMREEMPFCYYKMGLNLKEWITPSQNMEHNKCNLISDSVFKNICIEGGSGIYKTY